MKKLNKWIIIMVVAFSATTFAQQRPNWGFGIQFGDPTGLTAKYFMNQRDALNFTLGSSYFGELRLGVDYLWHFHPFNTPNVDIHAGFGGVLGFGESRSVIFHDDHEKFYWRDGEVGIGVRGLVGIDVYPNNSPFEIFLELGPLIGLVPRAGAAIDVAVGFRVYP